MGLLISNRIMSRSRSLTALILVSLLNSQVCFGWSTRRHDSGVCEAHLGSENDGDTRNNLLRGGLFTVAVLFLLITNPMPPTTGLARDHAPFNTSQSSVAPQDNTSLRPSQQLETFCSAGAVTTTKSIYKHRDSPCVETYYTVYRYNLRRLWMQEAGLVGNLRKLWMYQARLSVLKFKGLIQHIHYTPQTTIRYYGAPMKKPCDGLLSLFGYDSVISRSR